MIPRAKITGRKALRRRKMKTRSEIARKKKVMNERRCENQMKS
jgi:hypothetical protein